MSCARSSGGAGAGDPSSGLGLGSSSSTCSSSTCSLKGELGKELVISGGWTEKSEGCFPLCFSLFYLCRAGTRVPPEIIFYELKFH